MPRLSCALAAVALLAACSHGKHTSDSGSDHATSTTDAGTAATTTTVPPIARLVLAIHDGNLDVVAATPPFAVQRLIASGHRETGGITARGPLCADPADGHIVAVGAANGSTTATSVAVVQISGGGLGDLRAKLLARRGATRANATVTGCTFLADGRLVVAEHATGTAGRLVIWPAGGDPAATPCVLDDALIEPGAMTTSGTEVVVASAGEATSRPGLYADDVGDGACALHSDRLAAAVGAIASPPPTAVATDGTHLFAATSDGHVLRFDTPSAPTNVWHFDSATVTGLAGAGDGTLYVATTREGVRSGALWVLTADATRPRPMSTAWSAPGGVVLYVAPDR